MIDGARPMVPGYRLDLILGQGYGGTVWKATRLSDSQTVAIKLLASPQSPDPTLLERLRREGEILSTRPHACLIPLLEDHTQEAPYFLAVEYLSAGDLSEYVTDGHRLPIPDVVRIGSRIASALAHLHQSGVLHRDLKPGNLLRSAEGEVFLADLGLGRTPQAQTLTKTNQVMGSLPYLSPEVYRGLEDGPERDVFALGVTLVELLTGLRPVVEAERVLFDWDRLEPPALRGVMRMLLRTSPEDRPDARQAQRLLEEVLHRLEPSHAHPHGGGSSAVFPSGRRPSPLRQALAALLYLSLGILLGSGGSRLFLTPSVENASKAEAPLSLSPDQASQLPVGWKTLPSGPPRTMADGPASPPPLRVASGPDGKVVLALSREFEGGIQLWAFQSTAAVQDRLHLLLTVPDFSTAWAPSLEVSASLDQVRVAWSEGTEGKDQRVLHLDWEGRPFAPSP